MLTIIEGTGEGAIMEDINISYLVSVNNKGDKRTRKFRVIS